jgi:hypothetical protein
LASYNSFVIRSANYLRIFILHDVTGKQLLVVIVRLAGLESWAGGNSNIGGAHHTGMNAVMELFY